MIDGPPRPYDFIIGRDFRESLDQTSYLTNEETKAREAKGSTGSHVAPGVGAVMGQGPDPFLPSALFTVPCHPCWCSLLLPLSLTVKTTPQTFPAFSNSLHYLTFRSWLATWNDWTRARHLDTCLSSPRPSSLPSQLMPALPHNLCPAAAHTLAQHQGNVGPYLPSMWESYTDTMLMPRRPPAGSQSPGTVKAKMAASSHALSWFPGGSRHPPPPSVVPSAQSTRLGI